MTNPLRGPRVVAYQLPPMWDGRRVEWQGWGHTPSTLSLHTSPHPCEGCGHIGEPVLNHGILYPLDGETEVQPVFKRTKPKPSGRPGAIYQAGEREVLVKPLILLAAFRCQSCQLDTVWDKRTNEWWVLDESDYGPAGSDDPRLF